MRAPPPAAPRTLEASWPCPTAGTLRARPMRRPYGEPIAFTVVMHSPTLKSHCSQALRSSLRDDRDHDRRRKGLEHLQMTAMKSGLESNRRAPVQAMGKHRLSQASTKSIILEVPNGNATRAEHCSAWYPRQPFCRRGRRSQSPNPVVPKRRAPLDRTCRSRRLPLTATRKGGRADYRSAWR